MTVPEAAASLGVHPGTLQRQIRLGSLRAQKVGRFWQVTPMEVERYRRENRRIRLPLPDRFWSKVDKTGDCWLWTGGRSHGYGRLEANGVSRPATHIALELAGRPVPAGLYACHRCDNPPCVNPDHLFFGNARDNGKDMSAKGRAGPQRRPPIRGEQVPLAKFTTETALAARAAVAAGEEQQAVAARYGVTPQAVWALVHRITWKHI